MIYTKLLMTLKDFNEKGYPLVSYTVQELAPEQTAVFFKVIDGFIEKIDLSKVPSSNLENLRLS